MVELVQTGSVVKLVQTGSVVKLVQTDSMNPVRALVTTVHGTTDRTGRLTLVQQQPPWDYVLSVNVLFLIKYSKD